MGVPFRTVVLGTAQGGFDTIVEASTILWIQGRQNISIEEPPG